MFRSLNQFMMLLLLASVVLQSCANRPQIVMPAAPVPVLEIVMPKIPVPAPAPNEFIVFYDSDPPGAVLYDNSNNKRLGETPFWAFYELTQKDRQNGSIFIDPTRVVWPSGATATNSPGVVFALKDGFEKTYRFSRPAGKGSEDDYAYGLKRLTHRYTYGEDDKKPKAGQ